LIYNYHLQKRGDFTKIYIVETMASLGLINGLNNEEFAPNDLMTRAQFVTVLAEVLNLSETSELSFTDVSKTDWYYDSINKVFTAGIVRGVDVEHFAPKDKLTRAEGIILLRRLLIQ
jgi:N-acetylmuramoyl-L-alanine amidase